MFLRFALLSAFTLTGCLGVDASATSGQCGMQKCPTGTSPKELRQVAGSYDISLGFDPATYMAQGAFKTFGEGSCEYACQVIQACPDKTFPVITDGCFTCATVNSQGMVVQAQCLVVDELLIEAGR